MNPHSFEKSQKTIPPICQRILKKIRNHLEQSPKKLLRESIKYLSFGRGAFETERNRVSRGAKHPPKKKREEVASNGHYDLGFNDAINQIVGKGTILKEETRGQGDNKTRDLEGISTKAEPLGELGTKKGGGGGEKKEKEWKEFACQS